MKDAGDRLRDAPGWRRGIAAAEPALAWLGRFPGRVLRGAIYAYRFAISPVLGPHCRFHPTCSEYALEAIARFGAARGVWLALRRIARCHPWHPGGVDHVPGHGDALEGPGRPERT